MKVICYVAFPTAHHQLMTARDFATGLKSHGISDVKIVVGFNAPKEECDLALCWGVRNAPLIAKSCKDFVVMERAYFEPRFEFISLGFNGLNGRADFVNNDMPGDRFEKHFKEQLKPWKFGGDHILVTTQIRRDMSIEGMNVDYQAIVNKIKAHSDLPIFLKDHPVRPSKWPKTKGVEIVDRNKPIRECLQSAHALVTINSNSGVDAILEGVPVLNIDKGSMVWDIAMQNDFSLLPNPPLPFRTRWANSLAYTQWLPHEISSGEAWEHLKRFYAH